MAKKKRPAEPAKPPKTTSKARAKPAGTKSTGQDVVYQLKIILNNIDPPIWRQVQTKDCTLAQLHDIIQVALDWDDAHLHEFEIQGQRFGNPSIGQDSFWGEDEDAGDERKVKLSQLADQRVKKIGYTYDFGDSWEHTVRIEKQVPAEPGVKYPRCIAGERAGPPEDCGGVWGYGDILEALAKPKSRRARELLDWLEDMEFDPEAFDLAALNKRLQGMR